jgi:hypothetical protein
MHHRRQEEGVSTSAQAANRLMTDIQTWRSQLKATDSYLMFGYPLFGDFGLVFNAVESEYLQ